MKIVSFEQINRMTRRRRFSILFISAISLLGISASCHHDKPVQQQSYCEQNPSLCEPITAAKDYFLFNMGSWWVYEEATTHDRDSVYVTISDDDSTSPNFDCRVYSAREDYFYHYFPVISSGSGCTDNGVSSNKCIYIKRTKTRPGDFVGEFTCFFIQYYKDAYTSVGNIYYTNNRITVKDVLDTFELGTLTFGRTIKVFEDHTSTEHNSPTNHYFSKNVGLVRKEILDSNEVWNLVDYYIAP